MAYDPDKLELYTMPERRIPQGHYSARADAYDYVSGPLRPTLAEMEQAVDDASRDMRPHDKQALRQAVKSAIESTLISE